MVSPMSHHSPMGQLTVLLDITKKKGGGGDGEATTVGMVGLKERTSYFDPDSIGII